MITIGSGNGCRAKRPSVVFPPLASPRVISLQQRARVLFVSTIAVQLPAPPQRHSTHQCGFHPRHPLNHIAPLPPSLWDAEVAGWVVRCAWLNQNNVFVGVTRAQRIEHAPSDDASILNLCFSGSGHGYAPVGCRIGGSTTSLSAIGARRFVVLFSADDDRQFAPFAPCSLLPRGA